MKSGSLCALPWKLLSWYNLRNNQVNQMKWSLHQGRFNQICHWWHTPQIDLFATRFNKKLPQFVSPVPDKEAWAVDTLIISWEDMDRYAFPLTPLIANVINKILSHDSRRIIVIAPEWSNMSWFWDLVSLSTQIPLCLPCQPNLLTQPFNRSLHRALPNLNLHAWLLELRPSESKVSLVKWQNELSLHFCLMVQIELGGLQSAIYNSNSRFSSLPLPGKETSAIHYRWLQNCHS